MRTTEDGLNEPSIHTHEDCRFDGAAIAGSLVVGCDGHRGWVSRIAPSNAYRRGNVDAALGAGAERRSVARGCLKIDPQEVAANADAVDFFRSRGYAVGQRINMSKFLQKSQN